MAIPDFRFGKNAVAKVTPADPATGARVTTANASKVFCLTNKITIGLSNGTITIENFCTGGSDTEVPDGSQTGKLEFGDTQWTENDPALGIMETAARNETQATYGGMVWFDIYPLGMATGKPMYSIQAFVKEWNMDIPSKGTITVSHAVTAQTIPVKGTAA